MLQMSTGQKYVSAPSKWSIGGAIKLKRAIGHAIARGDLRTVPLAYIIA
jgi:hypothetical protein